MAMAFGIEIDRDTVSRTALSSLRRNVKYGVVFATPRNSEGGHLLEHWVACELAARINYLGRGYRLAYWRTVDGAEVDFVLETPQRAIPIEVKYTSNPRPADARGVEHFIGRFRKHARHGFVVCRVARPEQLTPRVRAIPWHLL